MSDLPEKPLLEHVYDLLETIRKILIIWVSIILLLLILPAPHLVPRYTPLTFYLMNVTRKVMLSFEEHPVLYPLSSTLKVNSSNVVLISHGWFDSLTSAIIMSGLVTIVVSSPVTLYFIYKFIEPGLYPHEKKVLRKYLSLAVILFITGVVYGFLIVLPLTFLVALWIAQLGGAAPLFSILDFYQNILIGSLAIGVFFMFPLLILALGKVGIVSYDTLQKNWRFVLFLTIAVLVAVTPDPTPTSALALGLPFLGLYFFSMWLLKKNKYKRDYIH